MLMAQGEKTAGNALPRPPVLLALHSQCQTLHVYHYFSYCGSSVCRFYFENKFVACFETGWRPRVKRPPATSCQNPALLKPCNHNHHQIAVVWHGLLSNITTNDDTAATLKLQSAHPWPSNQRKRNSRAVYDYGAERYDLSATRRQTFCWQPPTETVAFDLDREVPSKTPLTYNV